MSRILVRAPSRLHFGLIGWGPSALRQFGGLGMMIEEPGLELEVRPSGSWGASGPLAARALESARRIADRLRAGSHPIDPCEIVVHRAPPEHVGLGVGTSLTLSIAAALLSIAGNSPVTAGGLADCSGRGQRSGIGLHGFLRGGLLVDGGRGPHSRFPPLVARHDVPESWGVLVAIPRSRVQVHGSEERRAFEELPEVPPGRRDRIAGLILMGILPALAEQDLDAFGAAIQDIQAEVGLSFSQAQRGVYAEPIVDELVREMVNLGLKGVGQSSWGPSVYGFSDLGEPDRQAISKELESRWGDRLTTRFWTRASRSGASVERI